MLHITILIERDGMTIKKSMLVATLALALSSFASLNALAGDLTGIRVSNSDGYSRVVMDLTSEAKNYTTNYNKETHVLTFLLKDTTNKMAKPIEQNTTKTGVLTGVGLQSKDSQLQLNLNANQDVNYNAFVLKNPNRLVVDLFSNYAQKTTKSISPNINLVRWNTNMKEGMVKAVAITADATVPFKVGVDANGKTLGQISQSYKVAIGAKGKGISFGDRSIAPGTTITSAKQLEGVASLRYNPQRGYSIVDKVPRVEGQTQKATLAVTSVDAPRVANSLILYTPSYGKNTGTNNYGYELTLKSNKVTSTGVGNSSIPSDGFVLSGHGTASTTLKAIKVGDTLTLKTTDELAQVSADGMTILQGGSIVLEDGRAVGKSNDGNKARTFVGTTKGRGLVILTIDKQEPQSVGVTSAEGAKLLADLGAVEGLELTNQGDVDIAVNKEMVNQSGAAPTLYEQILLLK